MAEELCAGLAAHGRRGRTIGIKVRLDDWTTVTRAHSVAEPTCDVQLVSEVALRLLREYAPARPVRLLGVRVAGLSSASRREGEEHADRPTPRVAYSRTRAARAAGESRSTSSPCRYRIDRWRGERRVESCRRAGDDAHRRGGGRARLRAQRRRPAAADDHGPQRHLRALGRAVPRTAAQRLRADPLRPPRRRREHPPGGPGHDPPDGRGRSRAAPRARARLRARARHLDGQHDRPGARARRAAADAHADARLHLLRRARQRPHRRGGARRAWARRSPPAFPSA